MFLYIFTTFEKGDFYILQPVIAWFQVAQIKISSENKNRKK